MKVKAMYVKGDKVYVNIKLVKVSKKFYTFNDKLFKKIETIEGILFVKEVEIQDFIKLLTDKHPELVESKKNDN